MLTFQDKQEAHNVLLKQRFHTGNNNNINQYEIFLIHENHAHREPEKITRIGNAESASIP